MEAPLKRQLWLGWVAAVLAALTVYYYVGSWIITGVIASIGAAAMLRQSRPRGASKPAGVYCLNCGETMNPNARECSSCGSTRWTVQ
ncbi:MAG: zinc ribbon domain-containing protein [Bryobacteraceae bacterium]